MTKPDTVTVPSALVWTRAMPLITFSAVPVQAFDLPFLDDALARGRVTGMAPLDSLDRDDTVLGIAGAIHHMSRCGSTLLCRQFAALDRVMPLSEPFIFQHLLEGPPAAPEITRRRLRQLAAAWRDGLAPVADKLVIKWPGLLAHHAATVADAFAKVPMLFLHRNPVEVLESIRRAPIGGLQHVRGRHLGGSAVALPRDPLELWARLLAKGCRRAAGAAGLRTLDYAQLPEASWGPVAAYFGLDVDVAAMRTASIVHSKRSQEPFVADAADKRATRDADTRLFAESILAPARAELLDRTPPVTL